VGVLLVVSSGAVAGVGHAHTSALLTQGVESHQPGLFTLLKVVATWLSLWSGVPGGLFGPGLSIGAGLGADVAWLLDSPHTAALIALGMCGVLAGVTQLPITAMIIVMEMTDGHSMVLSLMACSLLASGISRLISQPLMGTQADLMLAGSDPKPPSDPR
jgi:H+/Cl- antiporter ClcA